MIYILFYKTTKKTHLNPDLLFNHAYDVAWFEDPLVQRIIREIDSSEVHGQAVLGPIGSLGVEKLSGTAKTLILLYKYDNKYFEPDLIWVGDNGFQLFADISKERDIYCVASGDYFTMDGVDDFDFYCVNDGTYGNGQWDWIRKMNAYSDVIDIEVMEQSVKELCNGR